jgi:hypothetical protein
MVKSEAPLLVGSCDLHPVALKNKRKEKIAKPQKDRREFIFFSLICDT